MEDANEVSCIIIALGWLYFWNPSDISHLALIVGGDISVLILKRMHYSTAWCIITQFMIKAFSKKGSNLWDPLSLSHFIKLPRYRVNCFIRDRAKQLCCAPYSYVWSIEVKFITIFGYQGLFPLTLLKVSVTSGWGMLGETVVNMSRLCPSSDRPAESSFVLQAVKSPGAGTGPGPHTNTDLGLCRYRVAEASPAHRR